MRLIDTETNLKRYIKEPEARYNRVSCAYVDGVGTGEVIRLVVDFLAKPRSGLVSCRPWRKIDGDEYEGGKRTESNVPRQNCC